MATRTWRRARLLAAAGVGSYFALRMLARARYPLADRNVLITGGSRGLGLELARQALRQGARVAICGRDEATLARAHGLLRAESGEVLALVCDVSDPEAVAAMVRVVEDLYGGVDLLINNAGTIAVGPESTMTAADFDAALRTNFWGILHVTRAVLPGMCRPKGPPSRRRRGGRVVNVTSIGGRVALPHLLPYTASKFAAVGLSRGLRAELAPEGVKVVTVCPGLMRTGSPRHADFKGRYRKEYAWFSVADSLPLLSVGAERAARRILDAARLGAAEVMFPMTARAAALLQALTPGLTISVLAGVNRLLPRPVPDGAVAHAGRESESAVSRSWLTAAGQRAARRLNQDPRPAGPRSMTAPS
jgi:NAD(P)-dependent dehydrogenase (short-subunit alcohol dehydrogenase family)